MVRTEDGCEVKNSDGEAGIREKGKRKRVKGQMQKVLNRMYRRMLRKRVVNGGNTRCMRTKKKRKGKREKIECSTRFRGCG